MSAPNPSRPSPPSPELASSASPDQRQRRDEPAAHVLLVDGGARLRRSIARLLEGRGMRVVTADDGAQAREHVDRAPPDVVLVDATGPGAHGIEVLDAAKARDPRTEVIVAVAAADGEAGAAAMRAGAYHVLTAPLPAPDAIAQLVATAAEHRRLADRAHRLEEVLLSEERFGEVVHGSPPRILDLFRLFVHLADLPYAEAKRRLVARFDDTYTGELLHRSGGNMSEAARRAGLDRSNFRRLLKRRRDEG